MYLKTSIKYIFLKLIKNKITFEMCAFEMLLSFGRISYIKLPQTFRDRFLSILKVLFGLFSFGGPFK